MFKKPKGTKDIFGSEMQKWQKMEDCAKQVAKSFNCNEIRVPTIEEASLYLRSVGDSSDIVTKEMYIFEDKGKRQIALRPEGTAGVVRAFIENGLFSQPLPQKYFYVANNFRYERPQEGRYREFAQFGVECFGNQSPWAEVEMMQMAIEFLNKLGIKGATLFVNSIGCEKCRASFNNALREFAKANENKLCEDCLVRAQKNPMRMLDCKVETCKQALAKAPKLSEFLCDECKTHFALVQKLLSLNDIPFKVDENLVRGFDYYTKTVFEISAEVAEGKYLAIGGGGRYDNLVSEMDGPQMPCVGFAMGLDRISLMLDEQPSNIDVFLANAGDVSIDNIYKIATKLRQQGFSVECNLTDRSLKKQFVLASKLGACFVCTMGENELKNGTVNVKDMKNNTEKSIKTDELVKFLKSALN